MKMGYGFRCFSAIAVACGVWFCAGCENGAIVSTGGDEPYAFSLNIEDALAGGVPAEPFIDIPYRGALVSETGDEVGMVLLSTCGCGYWRAYAEVDDDRLLARLAFRGFPESFSEFVTADGEPAEIVGQFEDDGRRAFGQLATDRTLARFMADPLVDTPNLGCVLCHVGDDPPRPLPAAHRTVDEATNCLGCHETVPH